MGTSKPISNTMGVQNRFVKHPRMVIILSLFLFHTHMFSLLNGKPPTLALKDHQKNLSWFEISYLRLMCDIKSFSKGLPKEQKRVWWYLPKSSRIIITTYETQSTILATRLFAIDSKYMVHLVSLFVTIKILQFKLGFGSSFPEIHIYFSIKLSTVSCRYSVRRYHHLAK
jgi:hypothetical protein